MGEESEEEESEEEEVKPVIQPAKKKAAKQVPAHERAAATSAATSAKQGGKANKRKKKGGGGGNEKENEGAAPSGVVGKKKKGGGAGVLSIAKQMVSSSVFFTQGPSATFKSLRKKLRTNPLGIGPYAQTTLAGWQSSFQESEFDNPFSVNDTRGGRRNRNKKDTVDLQVKEPIGPRVNSRFRKYYGNLMNLMFTIFLFASMRHNGLLFWITLLQYLWLLVVADIVMPSTAAEEGESSDNATKGLVTKGVNGLLWFWFLKDVFQNGVFGGWNFLSFSLMGGFLVLFNDKKKNEDKE